MVNWLFWKRSTTSGRAKPVHTNDSDGAASMWYGSTGTDDAHRQGDSVQADDRSIDWRDDGLSGDQSDGGNSDSGDSGGGDSGGGGDGGGE